MSTEYVNLQYRAVLLPLHFTVDLQRRVRVRDHQFQFQMGMNTSRFPSPLQGALSAPSYSDPHSSWLPTTPSFSHSDLCLPRTGFLLWISSHHRNITVFRWVLSFRSTPEQVFSTVPLSLLSRRTPNDCTETQSPQGLFLWCLNLGLQPQPLLGAQGGRIPIMINDKQWISKGNDTEAPTKPPHFSGLHQGGHLFSPPHTHFFCEDTCFNRKNRGFGTHSAKP